MHAAAFVPPHVIEEISRRGTPRQRALAERALLLDSAFRTARAATDPALSRRNLLAALPTATAPGNKKHRLVYDCRTTQELPGALVREEGDPPSGLDQADSAYEASGDLYDLLLGAFSRDSLDDEGLPLSSHVRYGEEYPNAFWDGERAVFGGGDGEIFNPFASSPDVVAHEFSHGLVQFTANLIYEGQPGALNESVCDCFAAMTVQRALGQTAEEAEWLIGEGIFTERVDARALRDMLNPGTAYDDPNLLGRDPQPASMEGYVETEEDSGGVHINSSIPSRAFALSCRMAGGYSWEGVGRAWYAALTDPALGEQATFSGFAGLTRSASANLFGEGSTQARAVAAGWEAVGLGTG